MCHRGRLVGKGPSSPHGVDFPSCAFGRSGLFLRWLPIGSGVPSDAVCAGPSIGCQLPRHLRSRSGAAHVAAIDIGTNFDSPAGSQQLIRPAAVFAVVQAEKSSARLVNGIPTTGPADPGGDRAGPARPGPLRELADSHAPSRSLTAAPAPCGESAPNGRGSCRWSDRHALGGSGSAGPEEAPADLFWECSRHAFGDQPPDPRHRRRLPPN